MRNTLFIIISLAILNGCKEQVDSEKSKNEILQADRAMSVLATQEGFSKAIIDYADENIVKLDDGIYPVVGKKDLQIAWGNDAGPKTITWEPVKVEVAQSGELGYTWGNWKYVGKDTTEFGNYFTAWKKNVNGKWKVMLDGGNSTPAPK